LLQLSQVTWFFAISCGLFFWSAWQLNSLAFALSPVALGVTLFYSHTKRFTPLCHYVLGFSLGIAPAAVWIATTGTFGLEALALVSAVTFWTAGFDIIYSLQDEEFDRGLGLRSIPQTFGKAKALLISRVSHVLSVGSLLAFGLAAPVGVFYWIGVALAAALLTYEQSLVKPDDLSKVNLAFFTLNGFVSLGLFAFVLLDLLF